MTIRATSNRTGDTAKRAGVTLRGRPREHATGAGKLYMRQVRPRTIRRIKEMAGARRRNVGDILGSLVGLYDAMRAEPAYRELLERHGIGPIDT